MAELHKIAQKTTDANKKNYLLSRDSAHGTKHIIHTGMQQGC